MCGFLGVISPHQLHHKNFDDAAKQIALRGSEPLALRREAHESYGYARLPTDGLAERRLSSIDSTPSFLLFNGLLTNVQELCSAFALPKKAARSDHDCFQGGFASSGKSFLARCRGMFAGAIVTATTVSLVRDTVGIKPLYYVHDGPVFAFASEIKAVQHLSLTVHEVAPGGIVTFNKVSGSVTVGTFEYAPTHDHKSLEELLYQSLVVPTKRYLAQTSRKRVAILLSGGVDSSLLAGLLVKYLPAADRRRLLAFSIGTPYSMDVAIAKKLAKRLSLPHVHVLLPDDAAMLGRLKGVVYRTESPLPRVAKVALLYAELAYAIKQREIDVVIGGEGADELFFGYHRFIEGLTHRQSDHLFRSFYKGLFPFTLLQRYDRVFAGCQIEGRVPFLDQAVIEYALRLSAESKIDHENTGHTSKLPLRGLAKKVGLPAYVYSRGKEKMTTGATGRHNVAESGGYLEEAALQLYGKSFEELVGDYYAMQFPEIIHRQSVVTEEALADEARLYRKINHAKQRSTYATR